MKILVCGGREFDNWELLCRTLDSVYLHEKPPVIDNKVCLTIIEGGAKGADFLARVWAKHRCLDWKEFSADWKQYGKRAGWLRNEQMLREGQPDFVIAFPGGGGTADMINRARLAGVEVREVHED